MQPFRRVKQDIFRLEKSLGHKLPHIRKQYNNAKLAFFQPPPLSGGGSELSGGDWQEDWKKWGNEQWEGAKQYGNEQWEGAKQYGKEGLSSVGSWGKRQAKAAWDKATWDNTKKQAKNIQSLALAISKRGGKAVTAQFTKSACEICNSPQTMARKDLNNILYMVKGLYAQLALVQSNFEKLVKDLDEKEEAEKRKALQGSTLLLEDSVENID